MNSTRKMVGVFQNDARHAKPGVTSRLLLAVIGMLVISLVGCGMNSSTNNHPAGLTIATNGLASGTVGAAYQQMLAATGGTPPYTWSLVSSSGALPPGLNLTGAGMISGVPSAAETSSFTVQVNDSAGSTMSGAFSITIANSTGNGRLSASPAALTFNSSNSQTFTVSGGNGGVTEVDDCVGQGIVNLTSPGTSTIGTWAVSPLANGSCTINFTDSTGNNASVSISVDMQASGTSSLTFQMEESDDCGGTAIYYRFFDETDNLVWPAQPNAYYFPYSDQVYTTTLSCQTGAKICYGGSFYTNTEQPEYWGVGIDNDESCPNCCFTCENSSTPINLLSCSALAAAKRLPNDGFGSQGQKRPAPIGRAPVWDPAKDTLR